jgi:hypothetical protein
MRRTTSRRFPLVRLGILILGVLIAAWMSGSAVISAYATPAGRTVTLTLTCTQASCSGSWDWYPRGGLTSPAIGYGSIAGNAGQTTAETTTQPAKAETLDFAVNAGTGTGACGQRFIEYFPAGSPINFTATVPSSERRDYGPPTSCSGAGSTFTMQS